MKVESIGNETVVIIVPSRYRDGSVIEKGARNDELRRVKAVMGGAFGGATTDRDQSGTFMHQDGSGRVVDELVTLVSSTTTREKIEDSKKKEQVLKLAGQVCKNLDQEAVLYYLGPEAYMVSSESSKPYTQSFGSLGENTQRGILEGAWYRYEREVEVLSILQLDGWTADPELDLKDPLAREDALVRLASHRGSERTAWLARSTRSLNGASSLAYRDLVFIADSSDGLAVYFAEAAGRLCGPRRLPYASDGRKFSRPTLELMLGMLGGGARSSLSDILGRRGQTSRFFVEYRAVYASLAEYAVGEGLEEEAAQLWSQRLLSRLMLLRFLEQRGWLGEDYSWLRTRWEARGSSYYEEVLLPAFEDIESSEDSPAGLPYLGGGLFEVKPIDRSLVVPDELFDPTLSRTALALLYEFEFTMSEDTTASSLVSVDPSMFGKVLESLLDPDARKKGGVHYTPPPIASALATEGLCFALGARSELGADRIRNWWVRGEQNALSEDQVDHLNGSIDEVRIVDPAVGSGGLLLAVLEALLDLATRCEKRLGGDLREGTYKWRGG